MDSSEETEMEEDILKLQLHAIPLDLNPSLPAAESEDEYESDEDSVVDFIGKDSQTYPEETGSDKQPGTSKSGLNEDNVTHEGSQPLTQPVDESDEELIDLSANYAATPLNLLKLNLAYQEVVTQQLEKIKQLLQDNKMKQTLLVEEQNRLAEAAQPMPKIMFGVFRQYLRDENGLPPWSNCEVERRKTECGELFSGNPTIAKKWAKPAEQTLRGAVEKNAHRVLTEPLLSKLDYLQEKYKLTEDQLILDKINAAKKQISETKSKVQVEISDRSREWDWDIISNMELSMYSPQNCRLYWKNHLHPSINHKPWSIGEIEKLKDVLKDHRNHNWIEVSKEMPGRTEMECCRIYQLKISSTFKKTTWTPEEDQRLIKLIHQHRVGNVIPYTQIAIKHGGRTSAQIVHRWTKTLDPSFKRAKWTAEEDANLIKAVVKYGTKWSYIRDLGLVPGRNDSQLRERYTNCLKSGRSGNWSRDEDEKLIELRKKTNSWSVVARQFKGRTDSQLLKRWQVLDSARKRGVEIDYSGVGISPHHREIREMRLKLAATICAEHMSVKIENPDPNLAFNDEEIFEDKNTKRLHLIKITPRPLEGSGHYTEIDKLEKLSNTMSSDDVIKLYKQLLSAKSKVQMDEEKRQEDPDLVMVDRKILQLLNVIYRPMKVKSRGADNPIREQHKKLVESGKEFSAKLLFGHFVKALNINAQNALDAIKRKKKTQNNKGTKLKDLRDNNLVTKEKQAIDDVREMMTGRSARSKKSDVRSPGKSRAFARNLYLPLCAPNRATTQAYRNLVTAREKRIEVAKTILNDSDVTKDKKYSIEMSSTRDVPSTSRASGDTTAQIRAVVSDNDDVNDQGHDDVPTSGDDNVKHNTEEILTRIRSTTKYKVFRSRFNALFTWPTLLASLVPYKRSERGGNLKPVVNLKRTAVSPPDGATPHKKVKP